MKPKYRRWLFVSAGCLLTVFASFYAAKFFFGKPWQNGIPAAFGAVWLAYARPKAAKYWQDPKSGWHD
jgi:hypothetical protein